VNDTEGSAYKNISPHITKDNNLTQKLRVHFHFAIDSTLLAVV